MTSFGESISPIAKRGVEYQYGYDDPPNEEADGTATIIGTTQLSNKNTTQMMVANGKSQLEGFENDFQPGTPWAYRNVTEDELRFDYQSVQFKFKWKDGVISEQRHAIKYLIFFQPENDPETEEDESVEDAEVVGTIEWNGQGEESQVFTIDPDQRKGRVDGSYRLLPVQINVKKQGTASAPTDGLIVKKGDKIVIKATTIPKENTTFLDNHIQWSKQQLKTDGTYTEWAEFGEQKEEFGYTTDTSGIFQLKAMIYDTQEFLFVREKTDTHTSGDHLLKNGDPDSFEVTDTQKKIDIRDQAKGDLGSTAYAAAVANGYFEAGTNKCHLFVAEKAQAVGATVPYINFEWLPLPPHSLPPVANQWAGMPADSEHPAYTITGWDLLADDAYPQPGFIVASGFETWATGHAGIVDYDGRWISAGSTNVNRNAEFKDYKIHTLTGGTRPAGKRKYTGN